MLFDWLSFSYAVLIGPRVGHPSGDSIKHEAKPQELGTAVRDCCCFFELISSSFSVETVFHD